ncbi:methionine ABC transporter ATP-binding protein [Reyranella sp. CPCC 100927]|uniref:methionine ABC transporter ATP-binding protein n=1 Tax=Reyranella sp. CPCC 100927 TaxID=2599616 RepID=UPI0011B36F1C|nr:methionine ABC transporter ATP-binding protein [Reyranella sp. CPCC 100927]TWT10602.1 methionine ABC transporter ATP-binding protein [Reyranella sp. CPCC 100927]
MNIQTPLFKPTALAAQTADAIIRFEAVHKAFPARQGGAAVTALEQIDLDVDRGSIVGVIGRSGAGKSTLIRLANGLEKPTGGRVIVDGVEVSALPEPALRDVRRSIGMIFQHFNLLSSRTAFDNVALPLEVAGVGKAAIKARVEPLLELVGLTDKRDRYPAELSGGQKQRIGIARALATEPKVLLSDEATSALDPETTQSILDLLASINRELGLTILLITHEMSVIRRIAQKVAVLEAGRVVEQGDVFDIFTRPAHATTRSFLGSATGRALPPSVARRLSADVQPGSQALVRIVFRGHFASEPVLAQLSRERGIEANLVAGQIDEVAGKPFGILNVALPAADATLASALDYLRQRDFDVEILGYVT